VKLIIDTDTGIDDAMGCVLALQCVDAEIVGITTVFGNVDVENTTRNTAVLIEQLGRPEIPLARGAARGFVGTPHFNPEVHGSDGVGDAGFGPPQRVKPEGLTAAEFIVAKAREFPGEITFVGLGPLTNLALAVMLEPRLPLLLPQVVWMGGAIYAPGNVTPVAEADARHDPESAQLVLDCEWNILIVSLDVTDNTIFRGAQLQRLQASRAAAARYLQRIVPFYVDFYSPLLGEVGCAMHSALTVGLTLRPELIRASERLPLRVELNGELTRGMTVADRRPGRGNSARRDWMPGRAREVVRDVDRAAFVEWFMQAVTT
jgi:purine nucleosidase